MGDVMPSADDIPRGAQIECQGHEPGFEYSWTRAIALEHISKSKPIVRIEYLDFVDDKTQKPIQESVETERIRPLYQFDSPSYVPSVNEKVEVFEADCWWEAVVIEVSEEKVCVKTLVDEKLFWSAPSSVRPECPFYPHGKLFIPKPKRKRRADDVNVTPTKTARAIGDEHVFASKRPGKGRSWNDVVGSLKYFSEVIVNDEWDPYPGMSRKRRQMEVTKTDVEAARVAIHVIMSSHSNECLVRFCGLCRPNQDHFLKFIATQSRPLTLRARGVIAVLQIRAGLLRIGGTDCTQGTQSLNDSEDVICALAAEASEEFFCPVSQLLMTNPITMEDGVSYDRSSLDEKQLRTDSTDRWVPNRTLLGCILAWKGKVVATLQSPLAPRASISDRAVH
eukprot:c5140_g1_i1.p2 GENE.c5140_g1_i1~~c5140_g1_i1.p2  ORF type:complete len:393 (-),score=54.84 c5140_g1_i1:1537-2715(-)